MRSTNVAQVILAVPAEARYIYVVRSVTAGVASTLRLPYDTVDDLRIATGEACNLLLPPQGAATTAFTLRLWPEDEKLVVTLSIAARADRSPPIESLSWQVIRGLTDESKLDVVDGRPTLTMVVRTLAPAHP